MITGGVIDYRHDPFTGTHDGDSVTAERHYIPQNTPRYIRLWEVPMEESPSSVEVYLCDKLAAALTANLADDDVYPIAPSWWQEGDVIVIGNEKILLGAASGVKFENCTRAYDGSTLATHDQYDDIVSDAAWTEVSAEPTTTRTYQVDYSLGYLRFASADNSKEVLISYTPEGSAASVYRGAAETVFFGDGSDGDVYVGDGELLEIQGKKQYRNLYIAEGGTVQPPASNYFDELEICCSGKLTVAGTINLVGFGAAGGAYGNPGVKGTNGGWGGAGGGGTYGSGNGGAGGNVLGSVYPSQTGLCGAGGTSGHHAGYSATARPGDLGALLSGSLAGAGGGGAGSASPGEYAPNGGGGLRVRANEIEITATGVVTTDGSKKADGGASVAGGSGAGSQLWFYRSFSNAGSITADGGLGATDSGGDVSGAGADGQIIMVQVQ